MSTMSVDKRVRTTPFTFVRTAGLDSGVSIHYRVQTDVVSVAPQKPQTSEHTHSELLPVAPGN